MVDFWGLGYDVAERMGLIERLRSVAYDLNRVRYIRADGSTRAVLDATAVGRTLGFRFMSLARGDLARAIYELVDGQVETRFGVHLTSLAEDGDRVRVGLSDGTERTVDLVVGADGLHSATRALLFPEARCERFLGYYTAVFRSRGYPRRDENCYLSYCAPGRQLARYALRDDLTGFFAILAPGTPLELPPHDLAAQRAAVRQAFRGDAWAETAAILEHLDRAEDFYFDAVSQVEAPAWSRGRVVLLGDAAACPSLLAGQGSALAIAAAYLLAHELKSRNRLVPEALLAFEARFRPFIEKKQRGARGFASSFAPSSELGLAFRELGLKLMQVPKLGEWLIQRMVGDRFDLPQGCV